MPRVVSNGSLARPPLSILVAASIVGLAGAALAPARARASDDAEPAASSPADVAVGNLVAFLDGEEREEARPREREHRREHRREDSRERSRDAGRDDGRAREQGSSDRPERERAEAGRSEQGRRPGPPAATRSGVPGRRPFDADGERSGRPGMPPGRGPTAQRFRMPMPPMPRGGSGDAPKAQAFSFRIGPGGVTMDGPPGAKKEGSEGRPGSNGPIVAGPMGKGAIVLRLDGEAINLGELGGGTIKLDGIGPGKPGESHAEVARLLDRILDKVNAIEARLGGPGAHGGPGPHGGPGGGQVLPPLHAGPHQPGPGPHQPGPGPHQPGPGPQPGPGGPHGPQHVGPQPPAPPHAGPAQPPAPPHAGPQPHPGHGGPNPDELHRRFEEHARELHGRIEELKRGVAERLEGAGVRREELEQWHGKLAQAHEQMQERFQDIRRRFAEQQERIERLEQEVRRLRESHAPRGDEPRGPAAERPGPRPL